MPDPALLTDLARAHLDRLPPFLRDDPDYQGVIYPLAREIERLEAAVEQVRSQFFVQSADIVLAAWEAMARTTQNPVGQTIAQRRTTVLALLQKILKQGEGRTWEAKVGALIGPGWSYEEHIPGDITSPPVGFLRIRLPFAPSGSRYAQLRAQIREITPANTGLIFESLGGFILDESQMDIEAMGV